MSCPPLSRLRPDATGFPITRISVRLRLPYIFFPRNQCLIAGIEKGICHARQIDSSVLIEMICLTSSCILISLQIETIHFLVFFFFLIVLANIDRIQNIFCQKISLYRKRTLHYVFPVISLIIYFNIIHQHDLSSPHIIFICNFQAN